MRHVFTAATLVDKVERALREVDRRGRHDGLVPITALRDEFFDVPRGDLDKALLDGATAHRWSLRVPNDPKNQARDGIPVENPLARFDKHAPKTRYFYWVSPR